MDDTVTSVGTLGADIGHGDVERGPVRVLGHGRGGQSILVPADKGLTDDGVGADLDDGDIGNTVVGSADLDGHGNDLAGGVREDLAGILERNTLAVPHAAVRVATLEVLERTLDVSIAVRVLLVENLVTAGGLETITGQTGLGAADETVSGNSGDEASDGNGGRVGLHCDCSLCLRIQVLLVVKVRKPSFFSKSVKRMSDERTNVRSQT